MVKQIGKFAVEAPEGWIGIRVLQEMACSQEMPYRKYDIPYMKSLETEDGRTVIRISKGVYDIYNHGDGGITRVNSDAEEAP